MSCRWYNALLVYKIKIILSILFLSVYNNKDDLSIPATFLPCLFFLFQISSQLGLSPRNFRNRSSIKNREVVQFISEKKGKTVILEQ